MTSARSNVKLRGQIILELNEYPRKADEIRNPMKLESGDSELKSERYPFFQNQ